MNLAESYRLLEVSETASAAEVRLAYRHLAHVWHPDRFAFDADLQAKATQKLATINIAYAEIKQHLAQVSRAKPPPTAARKSSPDGSPAPSSHPVTFQVVRLQKPRSPAEIWYNYGVDCFQRGQYTVAVQHLTEAIRLNSSYLKAYEVRCAAYEQLQFDYHAQNDRQKIQRLRPRVARPKTRHVSPTASPSQSQKRRSSPAPSPSPASPSPASPTAQRFQVSAIALVAIHIQRQTGDTILVDSAGNLTCFDRMLQTRRWQQSPVLPAVGVTAMSPNDRLLAIGHGQASQVAIYDLQTGQVVRQLATGQAGVRSLLFSDDGQILLAGCTDRAVRSWHWPTRKLLYTATGYGAVPQALARHPGGHHFWSAGAETPVRLRQIADGKLTRSLRNEPINTALTLSNDGVHLAVAGTETITVLNLNTQAHILVPLQILGTLQRLAWVHPHHLISLSSTGDLMLWHWPSQTQRQQWLGSYSAFAWDGDRLVSVDRQGFWETWSLQPWLNTPDA